MPGRTRCYPRVAPLLRSGSSWCREVKVDEGHAWRAGLFTSELAGALGLQISLFVIPLAAVKVFDANPMQIAILNVVDSVAALAFGLLLGRAVDSLGGTLAISLANTARAIAAGVVAASLFWDAHIAYLFVGMFVLGIASLMNDAGLSAAVVQVAGRSPRSLNRLNALLRGSAVVATTGGPGVAGALLLIGGFALASLVGAVAFAVAAVCGFLTWRLSRGRFLLPSLSGTATTGAAETSSATPSPDEGTATQSVAAGLAFIWRHEVLRPLTTSSLQFNFFSAIFHAVFLLYCVRTLGFSSTDFAVIGVVAGVGGLLGSVLVATRLVGERAKQSYAASLVAPGVSIAVMLTAQCVEPTFGRVCLVAMAEFVFSLSMVVCIVLFNTQRQVESPEELSGQVAAAERVVALGGELPGAVLGGFLGGAVAFEASLVVGAVGMALSALWVWTMRPWNQGAANSPAGEASS